MYSFFKHFSLLLLLTLPLGAFAQSGNSPYSRIGLGELTQQGMIYNIGMGGIGVSNSSQLHINMVNPALLSRNRFTAFEAGYNFEYKKLATTDLSQGTKFGNLSYLAFAFPVTKRWTSSVGLMPYSTVNYSNVAEERVPGTSSFIDYTYKGSGGLTQVYFANGVNLWKGLSLGLRINYNFGAIHTRSLSQVDDGYNRYAIELLDRATFGDFSFESGVAYRQKLAEKVSLNIGATYAWTKDVKYDQFKAIQRRRSVDDVVIYSDTITNRSTNAIRLPESYKLGISLEKSFAYTIGADVSMQKWSEYVGFAGRDALSNTIRYSAGGEWIPKATGKFFERTAYRVGFSYAQLPMVVEGIQLDDKTITLGTSLPIGYASSCNLAFLFGQRGTTQNNLIKETYFRVTLGLTVNDQWFVRRRLD